MKVFGLITARGGSKGIPGKNLAPLAGKPLIAWTIEAALRSSLVERLVVSTDHEEIAAVSRSYGAETPFMRPPEISGDASTSLEVAAHALEWLRQQNEKSPDYLLLLQPTSPLRTTEDINGAIKLAVSHQANAVVSVCETPYHPYVTNSINEEGFLSDFIIWPDKPHRRQDYPLAYALNGAIYINRPSSLLATGLFQPPDTLPYVMPTERSLDIDKPWELKIAESFLLHESN